ncbi:unnamed protein product [Dimorphilus gyrociliatus]|uniref:Uncharacterized protein n=1 Tax=Dimorphilus gyrociliatus TaxID=2664684 RepID=A0A7I8VED5_9ANNE|nr:unnamed protein product [Dimorphilus gyrociliatus]
MSMIKILKQQEAIILNKDKMDTLDKMESNLSNDFTDLDSISEKFHSFISVLSCDQNFPANFAIHLKHCYLEDKLVTKNFKQQTYCDIKGPFVLTLKGLLELDRSSGNTLNLMKEDEVISKISLNQDIVSFDKTEHYTFAIHRNKSLVMSSCMENDEIQFFTLSNAEKALKLSAFEDKNGNIYVLLRNINKTYSYFVNKDFQWNIKLEDALDDQILQFQNYKIRHACILTNGNVIFITKSRLISIDKKNVDKKNERSIKINKNACVTAVPLVGFILHLSNSTKISYYDTSLKHLQDVDFGISFDLITIGLCGEYLIESFGSKKHKLTVYQK